MYYWLILHWQIICLTTNIKCITSNNGHSAKFGPLRRFVQKKKHTLWDTQIDSTSHVHKFNNISRRWHVFCSSGHAHEFPICRGYDTSLYYCVMFLWDSRWLRLMYPIHSSVCRLANCPGPGAAHRSSETPMASKSTIPRRDHGMVGKQHRADWTQ